MRRFAIVLWMLFCFACFTTVSYGQSLQVANGLSYLNSSQGGDGAWAGGAASVETTAATVSVVEILKLLEQTYGTSYAKGVSWLRTQTPQSVAYVADRACVLGSAGESVDVLVAAIDRLRGGWGGDDGYATNIPDTAAALRALKAANYSDLTLQNAALAFLTTSQNADGGWGFTRGGRSEIYVTATVSATLQQFPQMATIATAVNKATTYLLAQQNADGSFGSPATPYETALAFIALVSDGQTQGLPLQTAVNYLTATQSANGSWNDDPYSTALALKALHFSENKPAPPPPAPAGGTISGTVIDAATKARISGVAVVLGSNSLINTTTDSSGNFSLADVPAGAHTVILSLSGYASSTASTGVALDSVTSLGTIMLVSSHSTGSIAGRVTDEAGKPLAGTAITVTGAWSGSTVTGADGSYSFTFVTPGAVSISSAKPGYQTVTATGAVYPRTALTFSPRMSSTPPQATTGTLVGRVIGDVWGLPIDHLPEEKGVTVTLSGGITAEPDPDNGGYFSIPGLLPNTYQVTVGMNGFASQTFRLVIAPGVTTDLGTIRLVMGFPMTLTGKVTDASTGAPIPGAEVTIPGKEFTGRADFTGTYAIADIPTPGEYTLKVSADGYVGKSFMVGSSAWLETMDISLSPRVTKGSLTGKIVDAVTEEPLAGVTLILASDPSLSATTNSSGLFTLDAVLPGPQQVNLASNGYSPRTLTTAITVGAATNVGIIPLAATPLAASHCLRFPV